MARKPTRPPKGRATIRPQQAARPASLSSPTIRVPGAKSRRDLELDAVVRAAVVTYGVQEFAKAERMLTKALEADPRHPGALRERGFVRSRGLQDVAGADADFSALLDVKRSAENLTAAAQHAFHAGRMDAAVGLAEEAIGRDPERAEAFNLIARIQGADIAPAVLERLEAVLERPNTPENERRAGYNALGRIYEKRKDYDQAFAYFTRSNAHAGGSYAPASQESGVAAARAQLDAAFFSDRRGYGVKDKRPLFVVGAPRSGSTLIEQVLTSHARVDSVGEFNGLSRVERTIAQRRAEPKTPYWGPGFLADLSKSDAQLGANLYLREALSVASKKNPLRIIDKALINFLRVPLISLAFPNATVLHTFRDPLDTCISCYKQDFQAAFYASDLRLLAHFYSTYCDFMEHMIEVMPERLIHVCHEDFVTGFDAKAPVLVERIGLPWDPACLAPEKNNRLVHTQSANSVRSPVNTSSFGVWRKYERHLAPLIEALGGHAAIEARYARFRAVSI